MSVLRRASDFEDVDAVTGTVRIYRGHPRYCQQTEDHHAHEFVYRYIASEGFVTTGRYWCDGSGIERPERRA